VLEERDERDSNVQHFEYKVAFEHTDVVTILHARFVLSFFFKKRKKKL